MGYNLNSSYGMHQASALAAQTTGKTFYVVPTTTPNNDAMGELFVPDTDGVARKFSSITAALVACVANRGDVIYVAPGYTETVTTASGLLFNKAGVRVVGLGNWSLRPTITFTTSIAASASITAANTVLENMIFVCGIDNQTAMINVSATDVQFLRCRFETNSATIGAALGILTAATSTNLVVDGCWFHGHATNSGTTTTAQIQHESGSDYAIRNNYFTGKMTQSILNVATVARGFIDNNRFVVATGTRAITMAAASTPFITNNRMNVASGTAPIVAAAGFVAGNVYSAAAGVTAGTASTF